MPPTILGENFRSSTHTKTHHFSKRDLYQNSNVNEYYQLFRQKDEQTQVFKHINFSGNINTFNGHKDKYSDWVVNSPRMAREDRFEFTKGNAS
jgi:hypothetical protein